MIKDINGTVKKMTGNKYKLLVTYYNDFEERQRKQKVIEVDSTRKAYVALDEWIEELTRNGFGSLDKITLETFYKKMWMKDAESLLESRSYLDYMKIMDTRIIPTFGSMKIKSIRTFHIQNYINQAKNLKNGNELAYTTKKKILNVLSSVFNLAIDVYRIMDESPVEKVKIKRKKKETKKVCKPYNLSEIDLFLKAVNKPKTSLDTKAFLLTAFVTGARESELAGLLESDIDFNQKKIWIHQRITKRPKFEEDDLKEEYYCAPGTKTGDELTMVVPDDYLKVMKEFILMKKKQRLTLGINSDKAYLFGNVDGSFVLPTSLYRKWTRFAKRNNLRVIRLHDIRHTTASFLAADPTVPLKVIQERLGHKDIRTTMNMYASALEESDIIASNAISSVFQ